MFDISMLINRLLRVVFDYWDLEKLQYIKSLPLFYIVYKLFFNLVTFPFLLHCLGIYEPSEIFLDYFADICDANEVKPFLIVNRLLTARLISSNFKDDVQVWVVIIMTKQTKYVMTK